MKATINGFEVDGTAAEVAEFALRFGGKMIPVAPGKKGEIKRRGRGVDITRNGELVKHCMSISEAAEELAKLGYSASRCYLGQHLRAGAVRFGEVAAQWNNAPEPSVNGGELFAGAGE